MAKRNRRTSNTSKNRADRRRRERERRKEDMNKMMRTVAIVAVVVVIAFLAYMGLRGGGNLGDPEPSEALTLNDQGDLQLATSDVTGSAKFYSYDAGGTEVRFFAVRGSDGEVRIALDACDVCYDSKRGYRQAGDSMKCNNCGNEYETDGIGTKNLQGGCWPSYIPMNTQDDFVIIDPQKLRDKVYMFK